MTKLGIYRNREKRSNAPLEVVAVGRLVYHGNERCVLFRFLGTDLTAHNDDLYVVMESVFKDQEREGLFTYMSPWALLWWRFRRLFVNLFSGERR